MNFSFYHQIPLWLDFAIFLAVLLISLELGYRIGLRRKDAWTEIEEAGGKLSLTSMFAILGLMLAFTFSAAISRHEARKRSVIAESNALSTAFLRAGLIEDPVRSELRTALLDYARTRRSERDRTMTVARLERLFQESQEAKARLWPMVERMVHSSKPGLVEASVAGAVIEVLDCDTVRVAAIVDSLPAMVLTLLLLIAAATVSVAGFNAGLSGQMSRWRTTLLILVLASIILVILDFDQSITGFIQVSPASIDDVIAQMERILAGDQTTIPAQ